MKPTEGVALGDRYRLGTRIAVGGMGEVWAAHDTALGRDVAVKVLREEFAGDAGFLERFRTEARNSAQLSHPNIAALYDYGEQDGSAFLVMELILGEPMSDLLDRQPVLPTRRLLPILAQTARALHAAHVAGVVHRDVKPGNILVARTGQVKITDFGISTAINQVPMTASGMVMGTAQYLSPEQAMGRAATPASDMYSLGIVAYEALVGHRPFTGSTAVDIAIAHVNTAVPPLPASIDPVLADLVMRMLDKEPQGRPRSAASLARHLDDMLDKTPSDGVPLAQGRHARPVDVVDADERAAALPPVLPPARPSATSGGTAASAWTASSAEEPVPVPGPASTGPTSTGPASAGPTSTGPTRTGPSSTGPTRTGPSSTAPTRTGPTSTGPTAPGPMAPGPTAAGPALPAAPTSTAAATSPAAAAAPEVPARPAAAAAAAPAASAVPAAQQPPSETPPPDRPADGAPAGVRRVSTSTGRRWGPVSHPFVALVLMVIFALLGALFADSLWGPSRASGSDPASRVLAIQDGMIQWFPGAPGTTTTARDL
ncbi:serine/threonine protein kinase [Actinotalea ferrariae CF5-4]|uniref:non-specific serine/threonine protein kinase n=1 Tax=Actinotalea ferrariae CF5-4 TaxID=948458 RepID=A0A021W157_9CELL|nr:serine/threonine-protein kinase [Actinotalea ferrariae]EYR65057.1 serine/threonine protein kinase [Actinotalea ferrariae CF5-4]